jgi:hypothetical protein
MSVATTHLEQSYKVQPEYRGNVAYPLPDTKLREYLYSYLPQSYDWDKG